MSATVVQAEGAVLERVLDATYPLSNGGLSRHAYGRLDAAQTRTVWGRDRRRRFALVDGGDVLASATQYDLAAILDQRPVRVCGIGSIFSDRAPRRTGHAEEWSNDCSTKLRAMEPATAPAQSVWVDSSARRRASFGQRCLVPVRGDQRFDDTADVPVCC
mgnify:CR=1 FL=1